MDGTILMVRNWKTKFMFLPTASTVEKHGWYLIHSIVARPFHPNGHVSQVQVYMVVLGRAWSASYKCY